MLSPTTTPIKSTPRNRDSQYMAELRSKHSSVSGRENVPLPSIHQQSNCPSFTQLNTSNNSIIFQSSNSNSPLSARSSSVNSPASTESSSANCPPSAQPSSSQMVSPSFQSSNPHVFSTPRRRALHPIAAQSFSANVSPIDGASSIELHHDLVGTLPDFLDNRSPVPASCSQV